MFIQRIFLYVSAVEITIAGADFAWKPRVIKSLILHGTRAVFSTTQIAKSMLEKIGAIQAMVRIPIKHNGKLSARYTPAEIHRGNGA